MNVKLARLNLHVAEGEEVTMSLGDSEVTVRQSTDGTCMVVAIKGKVTMEPRSAAIWLVVKP